MKLNDEQQRRQQRGLLAENFLSSEFFKTYVLAFMEKERMEGYPKPDVEAWENKYRYAYAKDEVYTQIITVFQSWCEEAKQLTEQESHDEPDITLA